MQDRLSLVRSTFFRWNELFRIGLVNRLEPCYDASAGSPQLTAHGMPKRSITAPNRLAQAVSIDLTYLSNSARTRGSSALTCEVSTDPLQADTRNAPLASAITRAHLGITASIGLRVCPFECVRGLENWNILRSMDPAFAAHREFAPRAALQPHIRAMFSFFPGAENGRWSRRRVSESLAFNGDAICPPILADGHACLSFTLGEVCHGDGRWRTAPAGCTGHIVGAVTHADSSGVERRSMIGAYFRAGGLAAFTSVPAHELTDRAVRVEDVWGPAAAGVAARA